MKENKKPHINIIAAVTKNRVIGCDGRLPWHIPEDMKRFKELTSGNTVILGRKTFESIGKPLPNRFNIVLSKSKCFIEENLITVKSVDDAIKIAESKEKDIFICGGQEIYEQFLPIADRLYITEIDREYSGDVFFPEINGDFRLVSKEKMGGDIPYSNLIFEKRTKNNNRLLENMTKEQLIELIDIYSKNWLAMDGVWFQSVESKLGMDEAMLHDANAWERFTVIEAKRIKAFLGLPEKAGIDGLAKALKFRFYANINEDVIEIDGNTLIYKAVDCRVQTARTRKGMELHPCKSVGIIEYSGFAKAIDDRFSCECISCYPDITDKSCCCAWKFTLSE